MESLENKMEPNANDDKKSSTYNRISLGITEAQKLDRWLEAIQVSTNGFLSLTRSDLVNSLIRNHKEDLSVKEIAQLRSENYNPIKHIQWIMPRIKEALASGDSEKVQALQEELRGVELSVIKRASDGENLRDKKVTQKQRRQKKEAARIMDDPLEPIEDKKQSKRDDSEARKN